MRRHFLLTAILVFAVQIVETTLAYADAECSDLRVLRSRSSATPADMVFRIDSGVGDRRFKIYWINYDGEKRFHRELGAGETYRINTYLTHPWLVTIPQPAGGEACAHIFTPKSGIRTVHLD